MVFNTNEGEQKYGAEKSEDYICGEEKSILQISTNPFHFDLLRESQEISGGVERVIEERQKRILIANSVYLQTILSSQITPHMERELLSWNLQTLTKCDLFALSSSSFHSFILSFFSSIIHFLFLSTKSFLSSF